MNTFIQKTPIDFSDYTAEREFEKKFNMMFPYLKIRLRKNELVRKQQLISNPGLLINESTTVKELCDKLMDRYGRDAVITRYTINAWLPVKHSKHWTLNSQNEEARKLACLNPDM